MYRSVKALRRATKSEYRLRSQGFTQSHEIGIPSENVKIPYLVNPNHSVLHIVAFDRPGRITHHEVHCVLHAHEPLFNLEFTLQLVKLPAIIELIVTLTVLPLPIHIVSVLCRRFTCGSP